MTSAELKRAGRLLKRATGGSWGIVAQTNGRYALTGQIDLPPLRPGAPLVFVKDLTPLQLVGIIEAIDYLVESQGAGSGEPEELGSLG